MKWNRLLDNLLSDNTVTKELECHISTNPRYRSVDNTYCEVDSDSDTLIFNVLGPKEKSYKVTIRVDRNFNVCVSIEKDSKNILSFPITMGDEHIYDRLSSNPTIRDIDNIQDSLLEIEAIYEWIVMSYKTAIEHFTL